MAPDLYAELEHLPPEDRVQWDKALSLYETHYAAKDLLFDDQLSSCYEALASAGGAHHALSKLRLPTPMMTALSASAAIYARTYWLADDAANRKWIAHAKPLLSQHGRHIAARMSTVFRTPWRTVPYRDDIVRYSNWAEAYTENEHACVYSAIGSASPDNRGRRALETIFHEASHSLVFPDHGTVAGEINAAAKRAGQPAPDQFWHAVIFYTAGRLAQERYASAGERPYEMFADEAGLWVGDWSRYRPALAKHWDSYVRGQGTMGAALSRCVHDISA